MTDYNNQFDQTESSSGDISSSSKVRDYGRKSMGPMVDLLHRYQGDFTPYIDSLGRGLQAAVDSFQQNVSIEGQTDADKAVARWFGDLQNWFNGARQNLSSSDPKELLNFLEEEARARPALMFSSSYLVGLVFGRLSKHAVRLSTKANRPPSTDGLDEMNKTVDNQADISFTQESPNQIH